MWGCGSIEATLMLLSDMPQSSFATMSVLDLPAEVLCLVLKLAASVRD